MGVVEMDLSYWLVIFLIGFIGSFISGMVGIGGSIIKYPMLLYIPPLLGFAAFTAHEVSGISAVQVFFATIAGVWAYRKSEYLNKKLIIYMGELSCSEALSAVLALRDCQRKSSMSFTACWLHSLLS